MTKTRGEQRAETARRSDDSDIIEAAERAPGQGGSEGGELQRDVASAVEEKQVRDPEAHESRTKEKEIHSGQFSPAPGRAANRE